MTDIENGEAQEPEVSVFDRIAMEVVPDDVIEPDDGGAPDRGESATLEENTLDEGASGAQDLPTDSPNPSGVADFARATSEIHREFTRIGVDKALLAEKTEDEILALGEHYAKQRSDREREHQESLNRSADPSAEAGEPNGTEAPARVEVTPEALAAASTAFVDEYGEEGARPHIALLEQQVEANKAQAKAIEALNARLDTEAQARQLAPFNEKIEAVWSEMGASRPALSEPGVRERVDALAQQIHAADEDAYKGKDPIEWMPEVLQRAADTLFGAGPGPARSPRSRASAQPTAPGSRTGNRKPTKDERWEAALRESIPD